MADAAVETPTAPEQVKDTVGQDPPAATNSNSANDVKAEEVKSTDAPKKEDSKTDDEPRMSMSAHNNTNNRKRKDFSNDDRDWRTRRDEDRGDRGNRNGDRGNKTHDSSPSETLIIKNVSSDTTQRGLRECFEKYGDVRRVNVLEDKDTGKPKGIAFIDFDSIADAKAALAGEKGKTIDGRDISLDFAGGKPGDRGGNRGDRGGRGGSRGGRGGRGRGGFNNRESRDNNIKTNYDDLPESDDPHDIRKQVEFYFSDSNLMLDKFLFGLVQGTKNVPVPISRIHSFKRMRHFQPFSAVVNALKDSELLDVNGDDEVSRKEALGEGILEDAEANLTMYEDRARPRSVYVKGFGEEGPSTQFDIEAFFAPFGPINAIRLRRQQPEKTFKGSVFVEFDSEDTQKAFLENKDLKWNDKPLKVMSKEEYVFGKAKDIKEGRIQAHGYNDRRGGPKRQSGDRDDRKDTRSKDPTSADEEKPTVAGAADEKEAKVELDDASAEAATNGDSKKRAREADDATAENGEGEAVKKAKVEAS